MVRPSAVLPRRVRSGRRQTAPDGTTDKRRADPGTEVFKYVQEKRSSWVREDRFSVPPFAAFHTPFVPYALTFAPLRVYTCNKAE